jgi:hypothetical protein
MKEFEGDFGGMLKKCWMALGTIANRGSSMLYLPKKETI